MASFKITDLTELTGGSVADTDVLEIVDLDADQSKKVTIASLKTVFSASEGAAYTGGTADGIMFNDGDTFATSSNFVFDGETLTQTLTNGQTADAFQINSFGNTGGDLFRVNSSGNILAISGSAASPSYSFNGDTDTGIFRPYANAVSIIGGGVSYAEFSSASIQLSKPVRQNTGWGVGVIGFQWTGDTDSGVIHGSNADEIGIATGGVQRFLVTNGGVGIGATSIDASAKFQIDSTTQGALLPRMTTTQRDAIPSPATGLLIFNTTTKKLDYYSGTAWGQV